MATTEIPTSRKKLLIETFIARARLLGEIKLGRTHYARKPACSEATNSRGEQFFQYRKHLFLGAPAKLSVESQVSSHLPTA
jgi:hypothetical protein